MTRAAIRCCRSRRRGWLRRIVVPRRANTADALTLLSGIVSSTLPAQQCSSSMARTPAIRPPRTGNGGYVLTSLQPGGFTSHARSVHMPEGRRSSNPRWTAPPDWQAISGRRSGAYIDRDEYIVVDVRQGVAFPDVNMHNDRRVVGTHNKRVRNTKVETLRGRVDNHLVQSNSRKKTTGEGNIVIPVTGAYCTDASGLTAAGADYDAARAPDFRKPGLSKCRGRSKQSDHERCEKNMSSQSEHGKPPFRQQQWLTFDRSRSAESTLVQAALEK